MINRMNAKTLVVGAAIFGVGFGAGMLVARVTSPPQPGPFGASAEQLEQARKRAGLIKAGTQLRQIGYAIFSMHNNDPEWTPPPTESALIDLLIQHDMLTHDMIDDWPGGMNRPAGEPPFYLVGTIDQVAAREPEAVLLVEHPAHHGDAGGSIVYADTSTEQVDEATLRRLLARRR